MVKTSAINTLLGALVTELIIICITGSYCQVIKNTISKSQVTLGTLWYDFNFTKLRKDGHNREAGNFHSDLSEVIDQDK